MMLEVAKCSRAVLKVAAGDHPLIAVHDAACSKGLEPRVLRALFG
jgi:hypothetical protein